MFTGIIETTGIISSIETSGTNKSFWISSPVSHELKVDQSICHNGVCLTVEEIKDGMHKVTAIEETLKKTNLQSWNKGQSINIERCLQMNGRLDGHIVQGHVDTTAKCIERKELDGSWQFTFQFPKEFAHLVIEKGSISLNGTSLTVFDVKEDQFTVAIIPYTYHNTCIQEVVAGSTANIEFDIVGKYIARANELKS